MAGGASCGASPDTMLAPCACPPSAAPSTSASAPSSPMSRSSGSCASRDLRMDPRAGGGPACGACPEADCAPAPFAAPAPAPGPPPTLDRRGADGCECGGLGCGGCGVGDCRLAAAVKTAGSTAGALTSRWADSTHPASQAWRSAAKRCSSPRRKSNSAMYSTLLGITSSMLGWEVSTVAGHLGTSPAPPAAPTVAPPEGDWRW